MRMLCATHKRRQAQFEADLQTEMKDTQAEHVAKELELANRHKIQRDEFVERTIRTAQGSKRVRNSQL